MRDKPVISSRAVIIKNQKILLIHTKTETDWYNPEWVSLEKFKTLKDIYPKEIREFVA